MWLLRMLGWCKLDSVRERALKLTHSKQTSRGRNDNEIYKKMQFVNFGFIHNKRKQKFYLVGYQDYPGARTWLNFNIALVCFDKRDYALNLTVKVLTIESWSVFCYPGIRDYGNTVTVILFNGYTVQRTEKSISDKLFNKHTVQWT